LQKAENAMKGVSISPQRLKDYPHQFSGGMKQRIGIAMSLLCRPQLVIADEPTTALDVIIQHDILDMIQRLQYEFGITVIYISHDIAMIGERCAKLAIVYAGQLVEIGKTENVIAHPIHPYTIALLGSVPSLEADQEIRPIPGAAPSLLNPPQGCRFLPRCSYSQELCEKQLTWVALDEGQGALCHFAGELPEFF
jgi:peptide/nickel transport system ATP-binding protein